MLGGESLASFLHSSIWPGADRIIVEKMERPDGGASWETWIVSVSVRTGASEALQRVVVRRAPVDGPLAPYEISKDVAIFGFLADSGVPVPRLLASTSDPEVFERPFLITEFVEGESVDLSKVDRWPLWQDHQQALGLEMIHVLAALQRVSWHGSGVADVLGPRGDQVSRVEALVDRFLEPLIKVAESARAPQPIWRYIGMWLKDHAPALVESELVIVHGDYRFGNLLWQKTSVSAVLDWERAMLGDPMADIGFMCMPLARRAQPELMGRTLTLEELTARYESASGRKFEVRRVQFWAVFWQFIEGVNLTLLGLEARIVASSCLVVPNLVARQTLELIEAYEQQRDVL